MTKKFTATFDVGTNKMVLFETPEEIRKLGREKCHHILDGVVEAAFIAAQIEMARKKVERLIEESVVRANRLGVGSEAVLDVARQSFPKAAEIVFSDYIRMFMDELATAREQ